MNRTIPKRRFSGAMAAALAVSLLPASALAASSEYTAAGTILREMKEETAELSLLLCFLPDGPR